MTRYILLYDKTGNWRRSCTPFTDGAAPQDPAAEAEPHIEIADLSPQALREVSANRNLLTIQRAMPTRMIAPQPMDDIRAADTVPGWGLRATGADRTPVNGAGVRMALLDTGIDATHPAFAGVDIVAHDFAGTGVADANGHGTHMAATVLGRDLGRDLGGTRIGVARGLTDLLVGKALADDGSGRSEDFLQSVLWALRHRADILCFALSFDTMTHIEGLIDEGYPKSLATLAAIHAYRGNLRICELMFRMVGAMRMPLLLGAAGNDSLRTIATEFETGPSAPATAAGVLAVGACGMEGSGLTQAPFSNTGAILTAPGVGILSAGPDGGLRVLNGSSMALAHAAGIAALWAEQMRNDGTPVNAQTLASQMILSATSQPFGRHGSYADCGHGLVQAPPTDLDQDQCASAQLAPCPASTTSGTSR